MALDDSGHEFPPASRGARWFRMFTGCLFALLLLTFLAWFIATNSERWNPLEWFAAVNSTAVTDSFGTAGWSRIRA